MAAAALIDEVLRREAGRVLATLIRLLGDFDAAEEGRQEAFAAALEQWPNQGIPGNASAWLITVGRRRMIDRLRRNARLEAKTALLTAEHAAAVSSDDASDDDAEFGDDRLRLIFTCCHPALNLEAQIALTLREVCGLTTVAVARAFLVPEPTMAQRLVRAKRKIRDAGIPYETPAAAALEARIEGVLAAIYAVFTEGYAVSSGPAMIDVELCREAIRLGRLLDALLPHHAGVMGLLALMLLHDARRSSRVSEAGEVILLGDQDRTRWNREEIDAGLSLVDRSLKTPGVISAYAVQAAIAAVHVRAAQQSSTDWRQIVGLYEVLLRLQPTPIIELNHAVAVSMVDGAARALDLLDALAARGRLAEYHLLHAARGRLLQQLGRREQARDAYARALLTVTAEPERRLLLARQAELGPHGPTHRGLPE